MQAVGDLLVMCLICYYVPTQGLVVRPLGTIVIGSSAAQIPSANGQTSTESSTTIPTTTTTLATRSTTQSYTTSSQIPVTSSTTSMPTTTTTLPTPTTTKPTTLSSFGFLSPISSVFQPVVLETVSIPTANTSLINISQPPISTEMVSQIDPIDGARSMYDLVQDNSHNIRQIVTNDITNVDIPMSSMPTNVMDQTAGSLKRPSLIDIIVSLAVPAIKSAIRSM